MNLYTSTKAATRYNSDNFVTAYISEVSLKKMQLNTEYYTLGGKIKLSNCNKAC